MTLPTNVVAVTIPVNLPSPDTVKALVDVVVPIPTLDVVFIPVAFFWKYPCAPPDAELIVIVPVEPLTVTPAPAVIELTIFDKPAPLP